MSSINLVKYSSLDDNWLPSRYLIGLDSNHPIRTLKEIAEINPESRLFSKKQEYENMTVSVVEMKSVDKKTGKIIFPTEIKINEMSKRIRLIAKKGDLLFPLIKSSVFKPIIVDGDYFVSDVFAVIVPAENIDIGYLLWALEHQDTMEQIVSLHHGKTVMRLNLSDLEEVKLYWLNEEEQASKSISVQKRLGVKSAKEKSMSLKEKIDYVFEEHFGLNRNNESKENVSLVNYKVLFEYEEWHADKMLAMTGGLLKGLSNNVASIGDIIADINIGLQYRKLKDVDKSMLIKGKDLNVMKVNIDVPSNIVVQTEDKYIINKDDILLRVKGKIGPAVVVTEELEGLIYYNDIAKIEVGNERVDTRYLVLYLNSFIADHFYSLYGVNKTMLYINIASLKNIPIILPGMEEQREVVNLILSRN